MLSLAEHPAARAWHALDAGLPAPTRIDSLAHTPPGYGPEKNSYVARLMAAGPSGENVIAKRCLKDAAAVERTMYEEVLPALPMPRLRCYGFIEESAADYAWLFLEEARGAVWDRRKAKHTARITAWLARMHAAAAHVPVAQDLPDRSMAYHLGRLRTTLGRLRAALGRTDLADYEQEVIEAVAALLDRLQDQWAAVETLVAGVPSTLVHGDMKEANVRIGRAPEAPTYVFDWEMAGWGMPAPDLARCAADDAATYAAAARTAGWPIEEETARRLILAGQMLRCVAAVGWETSLLTYEYVHRPVRRFRVYRTTLADLLSALAGDCS